MALNTAVPCLLALIAPLCPQETPLESFARTAGERHGEAGARAAAYLIEHMPPGDRAALTQDFLTENLDLAFEARTGYPWAEAVPEDLFLDAVLPYAVFDEPRDPWRLELSELARKILLETGASSASEAAQALNQRLFNAVGVHYNTGRKRPNQSLQESKASGMATCTGLSILLVAACRAVGIPARAVGTPLWANERGNHTWVEIWDGDWHFLGADEYDPAGLDRGWFAGDAAQAVVGDPEHGIYATAWAGERPFPMVWAPESSAVRAVEVTARYVPKSVAASAQGIELGVRLQQGGERRVAEVVLLAEDGRALGRDRTRAGTADLNDLARFLVQPGESLIIRARLDKEWREGRAMASTEAHQTLDLDWEQLTPLAETASSLETWLANAPAERGPAPTEPLDRRAAEQLTARLYAERLAALAEARRPEREALALDAGGVTLRWKEKRFGEAPFGQRSLWISMHGGGGAPTEVNDQQWQNQIGLYEPAEGWYIAPRAPSDTWNLWHQGHIDPCYGRLIEDFVALEGVDPSKVYLLGYSAGGDGVWQLAPRLADRFAAAAMMAGHPNEAQLDNLQNLPFGIFMGAEDAAYDRNKIAAARAERLGELAAANPGDYPHMSRIYPGLGHWMQRKDQEALPWMANFTRRTWPQRITWLQDDVTHQRFYWLELPAAFEPAANQHLEARIDGQTIAISSPAGDASGLDSLTELHLLLSDQLLDLDQPLTVTWNATPVFQGTLPRTAATIQAGLTSRLDLTACPTARLTVQRGT